MKVTTSRGHRARQPHRSGSERKGIGDGAVTVLLQCVKVVSVGYYTLVSGFPHPPLEARWLSISTLVPATRTGLTNYSTGTGSSGAVISNFFLFGYDWLFGNQKQPTTRHHAFEH